MSMGLLPTLEVRTTKINEVPYSRSASSLVSSRKVTRPIFRTLGMGVFEAWRQAAGKGVESHRRLGVGCERVAEHGAVPLVGYS
jgi:hypothetical protein